MLNDVWKPSDWSYPPLLRASLACAAFSFCPTQLCAGTAQCGVLAPRGPVDSAATSPTEEVASLPFSFATVGWWCASRLPLRGTWEKLERSQMSKLMGLQCSGEVRLPCVLGSRWVETGWTNQLARSLGRTPAAAAGRGGGGCCYCCCGTCPLLFSWSIADY